MFARTSTAGCFRQWLNFCSTLAFWPRCPLSESLFCFLFSVVALDSVLRVVLKICTNVRMQNHTACGCFRARAIHFVYDSFASQPTRFWFRDAAPSRWLWSKRTGEGIKQSAAMRLENTANEWKSVVIICNFLTNRRLRVFLSIQSPLTTELWRHLYYEGVCIIKALRSWSLLLAAGCLVALGITENFLKNSECFLQFSLQVL